MPDYKDLTREFIELRNMIEGLQSKKENQIIGNYRSKLEALRETLRKMHDKYAVSGQLTFEEMSKYNRIKKLNNRIAEEIVDLYDMNSGLIHSLLEETYEETFIGTKEIVGNAANRTIQGIVKDEVIEKAINAPIDGLTLNQRLEKRRNEIVYDIQQNLARGLQQGESYGSMSNRLKSSLNGDAAKAKTITRTEGHRIMESSKLDSLDHAHNQGVNMQKKWVSSKDSRVRKGHKRLNGTVIAYERKFYNPLTGGKGPGPGQMGTAADDVNCRCVLVVRVLPKAV